MMIVIDPVAGTILIVLIAIAATFSVATFVVLLMTVMTDRESRRAEQRPRL